MSGFIAGVYTGYDLGAYVPGVPTASQVMFRYQFTRAVSFANDFAGSRAAAEVAATAATVFDVQRNGVSIGTITYSIGGSSGTFVTTGGAEAFAAGEILSVIAPGTPDATLEGVNFTFLGTRT